MKPSQIMSPTRTGPLNYGTVNHMCVLVNTPVYGHLGFAVAGTGALSEDLKLLPFYKNTCWFSL